MSTQPGPDEKLCPYCAEVIKAAAIKCRYCHSDLPEQADAPAPAPTPDVEPVETPPPAPAPDVEPVETPAADALTPPAPHLDKLDVREAKPAPDRLVWGLAALCVALAGLLAVLVLTSRPDGLQVADNGQVTDTAFRSQALSQAAADATAILSYSHKTLEEDEAAARKLLDADSAKEYDKVMKDAGAKALSAKLTQKAEVLTSSLVSITRTKATALLFVNTVTTADGSTRQQLMQTRLLMKLERKDGDWTVSDLTPIR